MASEDPKKVASDTLGMPAAGNTGSPRDGQQGKEFAAGEEARTPSSTVAGRMDDGDPEKLDIPKVPGVGGASGGAVDRDQQSADRANKADKKDAA